MSNDWEYDYRGSHGPQTKRYPWGEDLKHQDGRCGESVSVEELYQAFKERLMVELVAENPRFPAGAHFGLAERK